MDSHREESVLSIAYGAHSHQGSRYHQLNQDVFLCIDKLVDSPNHKGVDKPKGKSKHKQDTGNAQSVLTGGGGTSKCTPVGYRPSTKDKVPAGKSKMFAWCIFDGHDMMGDLAARIAADTFEEHLNRITTPSIKNEEILAMFKEAHANILKVYDNPPEKGLYVAPGYKSVGEYYLKSDRDGRPMYSFPGTRAIRPLEFGSTALLCVMFEETKELVVAWVGDSKALLVSKDVNSDDMLMQDLTISHNGLNPDEVARIKRDTNDQVAFTSDGYMCPKSPVATHHLAMTRALGHKLLYEFGVIPEPQVRRCKIRDNDFFLVAASDGLWDNITDGDVLDIVLDYSNPIKGVAGLVNSIMDHPGGVPKGVDNTTAVLVHFDIE